DARMNVSVCYTKCYEDLSDWRQGKNKAKQSQIRAWSAWKSRENSLICPDLGAGGVLCQLKPAITL
ncbi:MAG: hypothetical protein PVJ86_08460, partial [Phycisphaerales bacterium]